MRRENFQGIRSPVKREGAERYVLMSLISFAMSVIMTRLFLRLTGYPKLGNSELHIAHVLWGGLLLFIAAVLPLILANRWAINTSAILSGMGIGLFIDEVGKFITQTNDYFYPPAAPIIYAFFLLTVLLYLNVRRSTKREPRAELYSIMDGLTEVLDHDLDPSERAALEIRLVKISRETQDTNLKQLANALTEYLREEQINLVEPRKSFFAKINENWMRWIDLYLTRPRLRTILIFSLGVMGIIALIDVGILVWAIPAPQPAIESFITPLIAGGELRSANEALWFLVRTILEGVTGFLLVGAGGLLTIKRERKAIQIATYSLVIWLTVINLMAFYLDQFGAVVTALIQFGVLLIIFYYRHRYLQVALPKIQETPQPSGYGNIQVE